MSPVKRMYEEWQSAFHEVGTAAGEETSFVGDYSHAWGATPTYQLSTHVRGIGCQTPGFTTFTLCPRLGPLDWASGVVPTRLGPIKISWKKGTNSMSGRLHGPRGCQVTLVGRDALIFQGGKSVGGMRQESCGVSWELNGQEYLIRL